MNQGDRITFAAAVVEIEVNRDTGVVVAKHVYGAMDCNLAVNPAIVESQIVGMSIHGSKILAAPNSIDWPRIEKRESS
jgi:CO/xanthine dehydrogenase Mo-binding subunit